MITTVLNRAINKTALLNRFKDRLNARNRELVSRCELVLTPSTLEIYPDSRSTEASLCKRIESLSNSAEKNLNVRLVIRSDGNGDFWRG